MANKKLLVRKSKTQETLSIYGELTSDMIIVGSDGTKVDLKERLEEFEGEMIVISIGKVDDETIEVIE